MVQEKYASKVVSKYGMVEAKVASTRFEPGSNFGVEEDLEHEICALCY